MIFIISILIGILQKLHRSNVNFSTVQWIKFSKNKKKYENSSFSTKKSLKKNNPKKKPKVN
jgi:hypothetical protein